MSRFTKVIQKVFSNLTDQDKYTLHTSVERQEYNNKSATQLLTYNEISLYINRAIDKRAEKVSEVQFVLRDKKGEVIDDPNNELLNILNNPNPEHTGKQFWKLWQKYLDITGSAYIYIQKKKEGEVFAMKTKVQLWLLRPDYVSVVRDANGVITRYEYKKDGTNGLILTYSPEEVVRCYEPDPKNPVAGVSLIRSGIRSIETSIQLEEYQANVLSNGGKVEGIFKVKDKLNKSTIDELKRNFIEDYSGAKKSGKPLFLGADTDYQNVALSPTELSYLESKKSTLNDICILTGVPKEILASVGDATFANADTALAIFLRETIKPLLTNLTNFVDWRLAPEDVTVDFVDPTPEDIDRKIKVANALYSTDSSTINERREMFGLEPRKEKEADEIFVSFSKTPLSESNPTPDPTVKKKTTKEVTDFVHPLRNKAIRDIYRKAQVGKGDLNERKMVAIMRAYFNDQATRVMSQLTGIKSDVLLKDAGDVLDYQLEIRLAKGAVIPFLKEIMKKAGQDTADLYDYEYGFTLSSNIEKWLDNRADLFAQEITRTTFDKLKRQFSDSLDSGENRQQLVDRIQNVYEGFDENRAKTIARTEVHNATQKANYEAGAQAGVPIKIWVSVTDDVTRDSHMAMDGVEVPRNQPFPNGLMFAGDPSGGADETINCRCDTV